MDRLQVRSPVIIAPWPAPLQTVQQHQRLGRNPVAADFSSLSAPLCWGCFWPAFSSPASPGGGTGPSGDGIRREDLEKLRCLETVEFLGLGSNTLPQSGLLTDDDLIPLERATRLKDLSLRYQPIGDAGISHLRNCRQLRGLTIMGTNIT